jgi:hypothetical protein
MDGGLIFSHRLKLLSYQTLAKDIGQNGKSKFDHNHPQNCKNFMVKIFNPNSILTISPNPDFLLLKLLKFVENVEISVNFDHLTTTICGDKNGITLYGITKNGITLLRSW